MLQILIQPTKDLVPPHDPVLGLKYPVPFVGEPDIAARNAPALKRSKHSEALRVGNAKIKCAVDHECGRLEVGDKATGGPLADMFWFLPGSAAKLPLWEPELLGRAVLAGQVEDPGVANQGLEAIRCAPRSSWKP